MREFCTSGSAGGVRAHELGKPDCGLVRKRSDQPPDPTARTARALSRSARGYRKSQPPEDTRHCRYN
jgi:hypothetical protein